MSDKTGGVSSCSSCAFNAARAISSSPALAPDRISFDGRQILLEFAESDFALSFSVDGMNHRCRVTFAAAVRAPAPSLETWWSKWDVPVTRHASGEIVVDEVLTGKARFRRLVDEWLGLAV